MCEQRPLYYWEVTFTLPDGFRGYYMTHAETAPEAGWQALAWLQLVPQYAGARVVGMVRA